MTMTTDSPAYKEEFLWKQYALQRGRCIERAGHEARSGRGAEGAAAGLHG